jgi:hypothetical protein
MQERLALAINHFEGRRRAIHGNSGTILAHNSEFFSDIAINSRSSLEIY